MGSCQSPIYFYVDVLVPSWMGACAVMDGAGLQVTFTVLCSLIIS